MSADSNTEPVAAGQTPTRRGRYARLRTQAGRHRQAVFELHVRQGRSLDEIGEMLGIHRSSVAFHWKAMQMMLVENAPQTPEQMTAVREEIAARLRATIEQTHGRTEVVEDGKVMTVESPPTPQMLAIRLRALEQMTRLYDLGLERPATAALPSVYMTPAALVEEVRLRRLELYRRDEALEDKGRG